jgi:hypothetical protein
VKFSTVVSGWWSKVLDSGPFWILDFQIRDAQPAFFLKTGVKPLEVISL